MAFQLVTRPRCSRKPNSVPIRIGASTAMMAVMVTPSRFAEQDGGDGKPGRKHHAVHDHDAAEECGSETLDHRGTEPLLPDLGHALETPGARRHRGHESAERDADQIRRPVHAANPQCLPSQRFRIGGHCTPPCPPVDGCSRPRWPAAASRSGNRSAPPAQSQSYSQKLIYQYLTIRQRGDRLLTAACSA